MFNRSLNYQMGLVCGHLRMASLEEKNVPMTLCSLTVSSDNILGRLQQQQLSSPAGTLMKNRTYLWYKSTSNLFPETMIVIGVITLTQFLEFAKLTVCLQIQEYVLIHNLNHSPLIIVQETILRLFLIVWKFLIGWCSLNYPLKSLETEIWFRGQLGQPENLLFSKFCHYSFFHKLILFRFYMSYEQFNVWKGLQIQISHFFESSQM